MGKGNTPKAPDPVQLAQQQQQANQQAAENTLRLNSQDRFGPFSNVTFNRDESGLPTGQTVTLNPTLQSTVDQTGAAAANLASFLPQGRFTVDGVLGPNRFGAPGTLGGAEGADALIGGSGNDTLPGVSPIAQTAFDQQLSLLNPVFARQNQAQEVRLAERGLPVTTDPAAEGGAFDNAVAPVREAQNQAIQQAAFNAIRFTPQEEQRQLQNALLERQQPFQEVGQSLNILNQVPGVSFNPQPNAAVANTDVAGIQQQGFQNQLAAQQQRNAPLQALLGTAGTLGGAFLGNAGLFGGAPAASGGFGPQVSGVTQRGPGQGF